MEQQRNRILAASKDFNPNQLSLDLVPEERREREADKRHWQTRLDRWKASFKPSPSG